MLFKTALLLAGLVIVFLFFRRIGAVGPKAESAGPTSSRVIPDRWCIASGTRDGRPIITRFNMGLRTFIGNPSFNKQLGIAIPLSHPTDDGLPGPKESEELSALEEEIGRRFTVGNESLFAGVITTAGMREFVLYTSNATSAVAKAQQLAHETANHHVQFMIQDDPDWSVFKTISGK